MTKKAKIGRIEIVVGLAYNQFGFAFMVSRYGIDISFMFWWVTISR